MSVSMGDYTGHDVGDGDCGCGYGWYVDDVDDDTCTDVHVDAADEYEICGDCGYGGGYGGHVGCGDDHGDGDADGDGVVWTLWMAMRAVMLMTALTVLRRLAMTMTMSTVKLGRCRILLCVRGRCRRR